MKTDRIRMNELLRNEEFAQKTVYQLALGGWVAIPCGRIYVEGKKDDADGSNQRTG